MLTLLALVACHPGADHIDGSVAKGPFVLGSTVTVSAITADAEPTGDVFVGQTSDDTGAFTTAFGDGSVRYASIEASGFHWNEATGSLSGAAITLHALAALSPDDPQPVRVNLATQLAADRVRTLIAAGTQFDEALATSQNELATALAIGPAGYVPDGLGTSLDLLGGDSDGNAWLFAVSTLFAQRARQDAPDAIDATLQEAINTAAQDLADDGTLEEDLVAGLHDAEFTVDVTGVEASLAQRLVDIGSSAEVPDLDRMIDSDGDGLVNASDNCVSVANADQADMDSDGIGDACGQCGNGLDEGAELCLVEGVAVELTPDIGNDRVSLVDLDGDDDLDVLVTGARGIATLLNDGKGVFADPVVTPHPAGGADIVSLHDLDADGAIDVVALNPDDAAGALVPWLSEGDGTFEALPAVVLDATQIERGFGWAGDILVVDSFVSDGGTPMSLQSWRWDGTSFAALAAPTQVADEIGSIPLGAVDEDGDGRDEVYLGGLPTGEAVFGVSDDGTFDARGIIPGTAFDDPDACVQLQAPFEFVSLPLTLRPDLDGDDREELIGTSYDACTGQYGLGWWADSGLGYQWFGTVPGTDNVSWRGAVESQRGWEVYGLDRTHDGGPLVRAVIDEDLHTVVGRPFGLEEDSWAAVGDLDGDGDIDAIDIRRAGQGVTITPWFASQ